MSTAMKMKELVDIARKKNAIVHNSEREENFGYPCCNKENILTDEVYKLFFASMLRQSLGFGDILDGEIDLLLKEVGKSNENESGIKL